MTQPRKKVLNNSALKGVRVLEVGLYIALPLASRMLASLGAEVIKVESGKALDAAWFSPTWSPGLNQLEFRQLKRSATLDLRNPKGQQLLKRLVAMSDIFMTNYGRDTLARFGLDFPQLKEIKNDLIILWQTGLGGSGPYGGYKAYGQLIQHACGISTMSGTPDNPGVVNAAYSDYHTAIFNTTAVLGALNRRRITGNGTLIECPIYESGVCTVGPALLNYQANNIKAIPSENRHPFAAPHGAYPCKGDNCWCVIAVFTDVEWESLCRVMGNPQWTREAKFATMAGRLRNVSELDRLVGEWTRGYTHREVTTMLQREGVASGIVAKGEDLATDEHLKHREFYREGTYYTANPQKKSSEWPTAGPGYYTSVPIQFSETPCTYGPIPRPGQDNDFVYGELLKLSAEEMKTLAEEGVFV